MMIFTVPAVKLACFQSWTSLLFQQSPSSEEGIAKKPLYDNGTSCRLQIPANCSVLEDASTLAHVTKCSGHQYIATVQMTVRNSNAKRNTHTTHRATLRKLYGGCRRCFSVSLYPSLSSSSPTILLQNEHAFPFSSATCKGLLKREEGRPMMETGGKGWDTRMKEKLRQERCRKSYAGRAWKYLYNKHRRYSIFYGIWPTL